MMCDKVGVIANRLPDAAMADMLDIGDLPLLSAIISDNRLAEYDVKGENVFYLPDDAPIVMGCKTALEKIGIL